MISEWFEMIRNVHNEKAKSSKYEYFIDGFLFHSSLFFLFLFLFFSLLFFLIIYTISFLFNKLISYFLHLFNRPHIFCIKYVWLSYLWTIVAKWWNWIRSEDVRNIFWKNKRISRKSKGKNYILIYLFLDW